MCVGNRFYLSHFVCPDGLIVCLYMSTFLGSSSSSNESSGGSATKKLDDKSEFTSESESTSESELIEQNSYSQLYYNSQRFLIFFSVVLSDF